MADRGRPLRLEAPAKLNLWLAVTGRRADGFHELDTLMVLLELADVVQITDAGPALTVQGPYAADTPTDRTNLAVRGLRAGILSLPQSSRRRARLHLHKSVPVAAGLGGGSSDAAAAWRLGRCWAGLPDNRPIALWYSALATIGADVPFFVFQAVAARIGGIGDRIVPAQTRTAEVVLTHPPFALLTAEVFAQLRREEWSGPVADPESEPPRNDLEAAALRLRPELDDVFRAVRRAGGEPHLTGSGPTLFTLSDDPERADRIAADLTAAGLRATRTRLRSEPASIEVVDDPRSPSR